MVQNETQSEDDDSELSKIDTGFIQLDEEQYMSAHENNGQVDMAERQTRRKPKPVQWFGDVVNSDQRKYKAKASANTE